MNKARLCNITSVLFIVAIMLAACQQLNEGTPSIPISSNPSSLPTYPAFVVGIEPSPGQTLSLSQEQCVSISQAALWQAGYSASELDFHIKANTYFLVDTIPDEPESAVTQGAFALDENNDIRDEFGAPIEFCFTPQLTMGVHTIEVITKSLSQETLSYRWTVSVKD